MATTLNSSSNLDGYNIMDLSKCFLDINSLSKNSFLNSQTIFEHIMTAPAPMKVNPP
jgi:hypothetical protein